MNSTEEEFKLPVGFRLPIGYSVDPYEIIITLNDGTRNESQRQESGTVAYTRLWGYNLCKSTSILDRSRLITLEDLVQALIIAAQTQPIHSHFPDNLFVRKAAIVNITLEDLLAFQAARLPEVITHPFIRGWLMEGPIKGTSELGRWFVVNDPRVPKKYYSFKPLQLIIPPKKAKDSLKALVKQAFDQNGGFRELHVTRRFPRFLSWAHYRHG